MIDTKSMRDAAIHPESWDVPGLLQDSAARIEELEQFLKSFLHPEVRGMAVPAHIRDDVREMLGRPRVES